jgi:hypothetical protein
MAARSLRRYQELLERVARRELQPEEIQRQFQAYFQERGSSSTRELTELSVGLLAGLLYAEARSREALLDGLLPPEPPLPPPPAPANADLMEWFQSLATYATQQSGRAIARHQTLVDAVAKGDIAAARVQEQGRRFLETHAPELLDEVMKLGLGFVEGLQQSSASLTDGLYDRVLGPDTDGSAAPEPPLCVDLRGTSGEVASTSVVVENTRSEPATVVCRASEFAARAFGRRFTAPLEITPAHFTLAPGEHRDVALRLLLDTALFAPDADYVATLQVSGAGARDLIVQLLVRAEALPSTSVRSVAEPPLTTPVHVVGGGLQPSAQSATTDAASSQPSAPGSEAAASPPERARPGPKRARPARQHAKSQPRKR